MTSTTNPKDVAAAGKPGLSALPLAPVFEAGEAARHGAAKYGRHNWRASHPLASGLVDAAFRHLAQWWEGEDTDPESGLSHLAHAVAGLCILRDAERLGVLVDDRPEVRPPAGWLEGIATSSRGRAT